MPVFPRGPAALVPLFTTAAAARKGLAVSAMVIAFALIAVGSLAPPMTAAATTGVVLRAGVQKLTVPASSQTVAVARDGYSASEGGTNYDWATLVLRKAGLPATENNVTVMTRWMRQENGVDNWWNRNNPLNNGWGSGGNSGLGSYDSLELAAENAAEALHSVAGYSAIVVAFASSAPTAVIESAIWASPWASGHYANGGHWSYAPAAVVSSPAGTWSG